MQAIRIYRQSVKKTTWFRFWFHFRKKLRFRSWS